MSELRAGYKETEIGVIPEDWDIEYLNSFSIRIGDGLHGTPKYAEDGQYYFINGNNLKNGVISMNDDTKKVDTREYEKNKVDLRATSILISLNGTIGSLACYRGEPIILSKSAGYITLKKNQVTGYIYQVLQTKYVKDFILKELTGTTIRNLSLKTLRNIPIAKGTFEEQQRIAEILSTTDAHIEKLDKIIEDYQLLKKGMMKKLLTEGIGHTEFKETEIGRIPKEWEVCKIEDVISFMKSGLSRKLSDSDIGIPCLRSSNIIDGRLKLDDLKYWYLKDPQGAKIDDYILDKGDILINFINSIAQIGKACVFDNPSFEAIYTTNVFRVKTKFDKMINSFFYYNTQTQSYMYQVSLITKPAVNQASFTTGDFKNIKFPLPTLEEQQYIADILITIDEKIRIFDNERQDFVKLKKSLMEKLLTGKIRTTEIKSLEA
ncbi:MAG: restriction endonuclease subunit S [Clostridia bacterium]